MSVQTAAAWEVDRSLNLYFCAWAVAGVRTQYENVRSVAPLAKGVTTRFVEVNPYKREGIIERLPLLDHRTKGSLRSFMCTLPLYFERPIDAVWTQTATPLFPFLVTRARWSAIPYVLSTDATAAQVDSMAEYGHDAESRLTRLKHHVREQISGYCYRHATLVLPWSRWAAEAIMREYGVPEQRIAVIPPGVDLRHWSAPERAPRPAGVPMRLLFVGGDFARKGGPLLLDVFRQHLRGRCELHLVTRDGYANDPGVTVYRNLAPNDPALHELYASCDALVLPTRADCFSLASIEAMASGLPVITCPVGGIPEIVANEDSGWLISVGDGAALRAAIEALLSDPARARAMGRRGRAIVEERFDADKNTSRIFERLRHVAAHKTA